MALVKNLRTKKAKLIPIGVVRPPPDDVDDSAPHGLVGTIPLGDRTLVYDAPVQVLQVSEDFCGGDSERLVAKLLIEEFRQGNRKREAGDEWFAWIGNVGYHPRALTFWIGLSSNVPAGAFDILETVIQSMGFATARATATPDRLEPLLYLGDDGLELLRMI